MAVLIIVFILAFLLLTVVFGARIAALIILLAVGAVFIWGATILGDLFAIFAT